MTEHFLKLVMSLEMVPKGNRKYKNRENKSKLIDNLINNLVHLLSYQTMHIFLASPWASWRVSWHFCLVPMTGSSPPRISTCGSDGGPATCARLLAPPMLIAAGHGTCGHNSDKSEYVLVSYKYQLISSKYILLYHESKDTTNSFSI